jgi:dCMP deaminase
MDLAKTMPLTPQDILYLRECAAIKTESHDPDRQVGAVIVDRNGQVLASGSNRPPDALRLTVEDSHELILRDPSWKYFMLEHAERNAINNAMRLGNKLDGASMYSTLFPCADCARAIVSASITRLVVPHPNADPERDQKWRAHYDYAQKIFELAGTMLELYNDSELLLIGESTAT